MTLMKFAFYSLWLLQIILPAAMVPMMLRHKVRKNFPFFFKYIAFQVITQLACFILFKHGVYTEYFYTYWACSVIGNLLGFIVIFEVFANAFKPFPELRDLAGVMFRWTSLVLVVVAALLIVTAGTDERHVWLTAMLSLERAVLVSQGGLLLFLLLFSKRLGMNWKHQGFGISLGFGFYASAELIINALRAHFGSTWDHTYTLLESAIYDAAVLVWTVYVISPEPVRATEEARFSSKPILERWNLGLRGDDGVPQGAFIPTLEKIVDRVLASQAAGHD